MIVTITFWFMSKTDWRAEARARLMSMERAVPAAGLSRWWRAGRAATGLLAATVEGRLGGEERALAEVMKLVERLGELKGVGMKMGQILGYIDPTMALEMRELLSLLHTASPASPWEPLALVRQLFRGFFAPLLRPGVRPIEPGAGFEAKDVLRDKRALMKLALPGKLLFLFRIRFGLYAVLARLGSRADWASLESRWASEALSERSLDSAHP